MQQRFRNIFWKSPLEGPLYAFRKGPRVRLLRHCSHLFAIVWCAAPYLGKIVWHYCLLAAKWM